MVDPEAKRTRPDNNARLGFCEGVYDEHAKKERAGKSLTFNGKSYSDLTPDELSAAVLADIHERKSAGLYGIRTARPYLKSLDVCIAGAGMCPKSLFGKSTDDWQLALKEAESRLTYCGPDLLIKEADIRTSSLIAPKALMEFGHVITTTRKDRDGDILECSGGKIDKQMPLLAFHNQSQVLGPFVELTRHDSDAIEGRSAILDTSYGRDMVVLVEGKALRISHGFKTLKAEPIEMKKLDGGREVPNGWHVKQFHIMEVSLVSVPANEDAVITSFSKGLLHDPLVKAWAGAKFESRPKMVPVSVEIRENGEVIHVKHYTYREESSGKVAIVKHHPDGKEEVVAHAASMEKARELGHQREEFEHMGKSADATNDKAASIAAGSGPLADRVAAVQEKRTVSNPPPNEVNGSTPTGSGSGNTPSPGVDSKRCPNCNSPVSWTGDTFVRGGMDQDVVQCHICGYVFAGGEGRPDGAATSERNANGRGNENPNGGATPKQPVIGEGGGGARNSDPNAREVGLPRPGEMPKRPASGPKQPMLNGAAAVGGTSGDLLSTKAPRQMTRDMTHKTMAAHGHAKAARDHMHGFLTAAGHKPNSDGDFTDEYDNPADPNNPSKALADMGEAGNLSGEGGQASVAAGSVEFKGVKLTHARIDQLKMAHLRSQAAADHLHSVLLDAGHEPGLGDNGKKESGAGGSGESDAAEDAQHYGQGRGDSNMHGTDPYRHGGKSLSVAELEPATVIGQLVARAYDVQTTKAQLDTIIKALETAGETAAMLKQQQEASELQEYLLGASA